jgi:hypothetical protein
MSNTPRTDFLLRHQQEFNRNASLRFTSEEQRDHWLKKSLVEYSRFRPRKFVIATVNLTSGSRDVPLPLDYYFAPDEALWSIEYGYSVDYVSSVARAEDYNAGKAFTSRISANVHGVYNYNASPIPRPRVTTDRVNGVDRHVFRMSDLSGSTRTETLIYNAYHSIIDQDLENEIDPINTLDPDGETRVLNFLLYFALKDRAINLAERSPAASKLISDEAKDYLTQAQKGLARTIYRT